MKRIVTLLCLLCSFSALKAQKNVDLDVVLVYPPLNFNITNNIPFLTDAVVRNVGTTTLDSTDVFYFGFSLDGQVLTRRWDTQDKLISYVTGRKLKPNDTMHLTESFHFYFPESMNGPKSLCLFVNPDTITNSFKDNNKSNNAGCKNVKLVFGGPNDINDIKFANAELNIYPNPAIDLIAFDLTMAMAQSVQISLMDYTGRVVAKKDLGTVNAGHQVVSFPVNDLARGIYIYQVKVNEEAQQGKIVIQ